jgi:RND family efflux transporter MFP subunit
LRTEVTGNEAALAASRAAAREQEAIVNRHTLRAPFAGVVSQRMTEVGEWVNPGNGLLELVAIDNLRFDFRVAQDSYAILTPQTPVEVTLDALPGRSLKGRVDTIVPVKNPGARTFLVRVRTEPDPSVRITPGMSARGKLSIDTGDRGIAVPRDAILRFPDGRVTVWVVDDGGGTPQVHERIVQTGLEFDGYVEVVDGVSAGERVVVRGNETLQEGQEVSILDGVR